MACLKGLSTNYSLLCVNKFKISLSQVRGALYDWARGGHTVDASGEVAALGNRVISWRDLRTPASLPVNH